jgi:hypothetical protein
MQIPLKVSSKMEKGGQDAIIRAPKDFRDFYQYGLYEFITLKSHEGRLLTLQVLPAYEEDTDVDTLSAYVSEKIFGMLKTSNVEEGTQEVEVVEGITLGCDPEFFLTDEVGELIPAPLFFRRDGPLGYDGKMVEIRPAPSLSEEVVADNIMEQIRKARAAIDARISVTHMQKITPAANIQMIAASSYRGEAAGFHIHFGLPTPLLGKYQFNQKELAKQIIKALDFYVGVPAIIPEGAEDSLRRTFSMSSYGKPGNFRLGNRTLEYRVPGGYLLRHPILTKGLMALGAVVVEDLVSRIRICTSEFVNLNVMVPNTSLGLLYPNVPTLEVIYGSIAVRNTSPAEAQMQIIMRDVRNMVGYGKRKKAIEEFFRCITEKVSFHNNIEINWREYYHARQSGQMEIHSA